MKKHARTIAAGLVAALAIPTAVFAADQAKKTDADSTPIPAEMRTMIEDQVAQLGFTLVKIEAEDDEYEVYATRNRERFEIEFDRTTGEIVELERED